MPFYPTLAYSNQSQQMIDVFGGYNHNMKINEGEFFHMKNLTSDFYPLLSTRGKRGTVATLTTPRAILGKSQLAYIDGNRLFYNGLDITSYITAAGFSISQDAGMLPKKLVSMGAYIVIFPDKLYINTENYTDCGSIDASFSTVENVAVSYTICKIDGTAYATPTSSATQPENASNGDLWLDTSNNTHVLKIYSEASGMWTQIPTVYTKISYAGIGVQFEKNDGVDISGCDATGAGSVIEGQISALNGTKIIYDKADDYIVVVGLLDQSYSQTSGSITISRSAPDMDYITEAENRLWGCKYGLVNGKTLNEIYCCALGDFKNWHQFLGLSTDSYTASVGTDGPFTGAITHLGYPLFFKENCFHKVYISAQGAHQIVDTACRGVQPGSSESLCVVNELLFYKAAGNVMVYDGSLPTEVGNSFGTEKYFDATAGGIGNKYYISMRDVLNNWNIFVFDTARGLWHREDETHALCWAKCGNELYYIDADTNALMAELGTTGTPEDDISWEAESGLIGYTDVNQKYISRFNFRMKLPACTVYLEYDSDGVWHNVGSIAGTGTRTFLLPVKPRRCDHFRYKLTGTGDTKIYSFAKLYESGSDATL